VYIFILGYTQEHQTEAGVEPPPGKWHISNSLSYESSCSRWKSWKKAFDDDTISMMFFARTYINPFDAHDMNTIIIESFVKPFNKVVVYNKQDVPEQPKPSGPLAGLGLSQFINTPAPPQTTDWNALYNEVTGVEF
jgi:hypothetical protein